jgi:hypothetical protein
MRTGEVFLWAYVGIVAVAVGTVVAALALGGRRG